MGTGYTRNDTANNIADGNVINAADLDGEFDAIESAFNSSTGHTHDGTSAEGAPIEVVGPTQDVVITASALRPKTDNTVDLGTSALMYKDGFFDGTVTVHSLVVFDDEGTDATIKLDGNYPDGTANVALGLTALDSLDGSSPGGNNIAIGNAALTALTTGSHNIAIGSSAGDALTTGGKNIAIGFEALSTEDGNGESTAIGYQALKTQNAGASGLNVAVGYLAGTAVSTGVKNTLLGAEAGDAINSGGSNVAVGYNALTATTTSSSNTAVGADALKTNITGASNVAVGNTALEVATGSNNTAIGKDAGNLITSGAANTIIGQFDGNQGTLETLDIRTSSNHIVLSDGAGEPRIVVDDSGRVLVGNTSSVQVGAGVHDLQVSGTAASRLSLLRYAAAVSGSNLTLGHTRSATVGTVGTALVDNDTLGQIDFAGDDGADVVTIGARIRALVNGTPSSNNMPADLMFQTFEDGGSLTERMRITSTGNVGIGTTDTNGGRLVVGSAVSGDTSLIQLLRTGVTERTNFIGLSDSDALVISADENNEGADSNIRFKVDGSEVVHIDASGNVGIGQSSPSYPLHITTASGDAQMKLETGGTGSGDHTIVRYAIGGTTASNYIYFGDSGDSNAGQIRYDHTDDFMSFNINAAERLRIDSTGQVGINTSSPDATLHIADIGSTHPALLISGGGGTEGDITVPHDENMQIGHWNTTTDTFTSRLHVDTSGNVGLGVDSSLGGELHVKSTAAGATILLESTADSAADGPILDLYRNRANPADDDNIGIIYFSGEDDTGAKKQYARIDAFIEDATAATTKGRMTFAVQTAGSSTQLFTIRGDTGGANGQVIVNENSNDVDFKIEGNGKTNLFYCDASADKIGIGTASPDTLLHLSAANNSTDVNNVLRFTDTDTAVVADQFIGRIEFETTDTSNAGVNCRLDALYGGSGAGSEFRILTGVAGALEDRMYIQDVETVFNEGGGDNNFRIESENYTGMFFLDAALDRIGMGTTSPQVTLHLQRTSAEPIIRFQRTGATNAASSNLGGLEWYNSDGSSDGPGIQAKILGESYGSSGAGMKLVFFTHDGTEGGEGSDPVERMTLRGDGCLSLSDNGYNAAGSSTVSFARNLTVSPEGTTVGGTSAARINIVGETPANTDKGVSYAGLSFGMRAAAGSGWDDDIIASVECLDFRNGSTSNEDGGIGFYTTASSSHYNFRGGMSNLGGFRIDGTVSDTGAEDLYVGDDVEIIGALTKGSGSFKIPHPIKPHTHHLVHSFVEGPQADNIYRGRATLVAGTASINIDTEAGMTDGTFVLLNRDVQCFTSNETGWTAVKGSVSGNTLTITAQDNTCTDTISWMVIGERQDDVIYESSLTDANGKFIVEPMRSIDGMKAGA